MARNCIVKLVTYCRKLGHYNNICKEPGNGSGGGNSGKVQVERLNTTRQILITNVTRLFNLTTSFKEMDTSIITKLMIF